MNLLSTMVLCKKTKSKDEKLKNTKKQGPSNDDDEGEKVRILVALNNTRNRNNDAPKNSNLEVSVRTG